MTTVRSYPISKFVGNNLVKTNDLVIVTDPVFTTNGENHIIVKDVPNCTIKLNSQNTDKTTIKVLTKVLILPDVGKIDEEYDELVIDKGACIEFYFGFGNWYILSSDGIKND